MDSNKMFRALLLATEVVCYCSSEAMVTTKPRLPNPFLTERHIEEILCRQKDNCFSFLPLDMRSCYMLPLILKSIEADRAAHTHEDKDYEQLIASLSSSSVSLKEKYQICTKYKESHSLDSEKTPYNFTLLSSMIIAGKLDVAEMLIKLGADVNKSSRLYYNALMVASAINSVAAVQLLQKYYVKIDQAIYDNRTALWIAARMGHFEIIRILLDADADPNPRQEFCLETALYAAASKNHVEVVQHLLDAKADLEIPDSRGFTPLAIASENGHSEVVSLLLSKNADPNKISMLGFSAIGQASRNGHLQVVTLLLQHNTNPNPNPNPTTNLSPLDLALCNNHKKIALLLEAHGGKRSKR